MAELSLTEWVVLALIADTPTHGFAIARELTPESDLGRILTVHRPLVYRALDRLRDSGLVEATATEPGDGGPNRTVMKVTRRGRSQLNRWLKTPVEHVRELRIEFLIKLRLTERMGKDRAVLVDAQQERLAGTLKSLTADPAEQDGEHRDMDVVDHWRRHNAIAAQAFLENL